MSASHCREPIKHTCPDIDKWIKSIKYEMVRDSNLKNMSQEQLYDAASAMNNELERCIDYLGSLRESNHELREWGINEAERVDELESRLEEEATPVESTYRLPMPTVEEILEPIQSICDEFKKATS